MGNGMTDLKAEENFAPGKANAEAGIDADGQEVPTPTASPQSSLKKKDEASPSSVESPVQRGKKRVSFNDAGEDGDEGKLRKVTSDAPKQEDDEENLTLMQAAAKANTVEKEEQVQIKTESLRPKEDHFQSEDKENASPSAKRPRGVFVESTKRPRGEESIMHESKALGFNMVRVGEKVGDDSGLVLRNTCSGQIKIPKGAIIAQFTENTYLCKNSQGYSYKLDMKTAIYDFTRKKKMKLEEYIADGHPTEKIWKYKPFPPGPPPKIMILDTPENSYQFDSKAQNREAVLATVEACRGLKCANLVWAVTYKKDRKLIQPFGLVLLANKVITIPADQEVPVS